jgi:hypothetical protein
MGEGEMREMEMGDVMEIEEREQVRLEDLVILTKGQEFVPFVPNRAQAHLLARLTGRDLVLKARQMGISTAVQAHMFLQAVNGVARVTTLAQDKVTTDKLRDVAVQFYEALPPEQQPVRVVNSATRMRFGNQSILYYGTAGNPRGGRGGTYSHVHGSEVAFWKNGRQMLAGLLQGVPAEGSIVLESTANGARGWFYDQVMGALNGENQWTLHFFPWWWEAGYTLAVDAPLDLAEEEARLVQAHGLTDGQIAWRRAKQIELGELFRQEYPEDVYSAFLVSGEGYFVVREGMFWGEALTPRPPLPHVRYAHGGEGERRGDEERGELNHRSAEGEGKGEGGKIKGERDGEKILFKRGREEEDGEGKGVRTEGGREPEWRGGEGEIGAVMGHRYVAGLDFGQANDYTVCSVIDATTRRQVAIYRARRRAWAEMRREIEVLCATWNIHILVAESNAMGGTNIEALRAELATRGSTTAVVPFVMTHSHKAQIMAELRLALEEGGLKLLPDKVQRHELEIFASRQTATGVWQLGAPLHEHDDCVIALALANHAMSGGAMVMFG